MALQKQIECPDGFVGDYIRLGPTRWDPITQELSAQFLLYASAAKRAANPESPRGVIAFLRLNGAKFAQYVGATDLDSAAIYAAAKTEPLLAGMALTEISFADAIDV